MPSFFLIFEAGPEGAPAGAGRNRFLSPLVEEYKPQLAAWRTLTTRLRSELAPPRGVWASDPGSTETSCILASEQRFFDFRVSGEWAASGRVRSQVVAGRAKKDREAL